MYHPHLVIAKSYSKGFLLLLKGKVSEMTIYSWTQRSYILHSLLSAQILNGTSWFNLINFIHENDLNLCPKTCTRFTSLNGLSKSLQFQGYLPKILIHYKREDKLLHTGDTDTNLTSNRTWKSTSEEGQEK